MQNDKVLVIFSSPHKNGFTARLLQRFLEQEGISNYYFFDCYKEMPQPCIACNKCEKEFSCSRSDLGEFGRAFLDCNKLIIAAPIYNGGLPAPLKALADRAQIFYSARFSRGERNLAAEKQAVILATCGSELDKTRNLLDIFLPIFSVTSTKLSGCCLWCGTDKGAPPPEQLPSFK